MLDTIKGVFKIQNLRQKIIATLLLVLVYKVLATIPVPGVNTEGLQAMLAKDENSGLGFFSALMGGGMNNFSIILMGLSPYINAMIILQLMGVIVPKLGELQKEGEAGQKVITKYTRWLTLPLAIAQSYGMIFLLNSLAGGTILYTSNTQTVLMAMAIITTGTMFLMWLGEVMTERGIGNGISIIITAGVLAATPQVIMGHINNENYPLFAGLIIATLVIIYIIVKFTEGTRRIPVIYTRTGREEKSYFPIKVNQAGMVPIIFAVSLVTFPSILGQILSNSTGTAQTIGGFMMKWFNMSNPEWPMIIAYFLLVLGFSFFYVSITFNTEQIAESIQKRGGYIPGIRPGVETEEYFSKVSGCLNVFGGGFLALIAVAPYIMGKFYGSSIDFIVSGAGLIIIVSVILDLIRRIKSEKQMQDYSQF
ncbi:MAG: preprotein translocase subunit SecY [Candidatus Gracilibacteria bacterium]|nr:preprotein translocase subunit SecY [Candidatus Gracilibacteria bacterium]